MSKVTITELASVLMDKHGLKRTEAELFIRQFVVVVNESLTTDKIAKIKGLGTFKVTSVSPRKSVDVNTGEPIIIDGRDKITFTADTAMRDLVNAPFAQFETVVVNEGVDFSVIDEKHKNEMKDDSVDTETESQPSAVEIVPVAEAEPEPIPEQEPTLEQENISEPETVTVMIGEHDTTHDAESAPADIEEVKFEPEPQPETTQDKGQSSDTESLPESVSTVTNSDRQTIQTPESKRLVSVNEKLMEANEILSEQIRLFKTRTTILFSSLIFVVIAAIAGFFYLVSQLEKRNNRIDFLEEQTVSLLDKVVKKHTPVVDSATIKAKADSMKAIQEQANMILQRQKGDDAKEKQIVAKKAVEVKKDTEAKKTAEEKKTAEIKKSTRSKKTVDTKQADTQSVYNKDARVRTGAYLITGIAKTLTVKPGQTLSSISKAYLGPGMECYIEAVNNGKTTFNAGEKIKIPELKLKKKKSAQ